MKTSKLATRNVIKLLIALTVLAGFSSCKKSENPFFASGTFEATEVIVSSEANGKILQFSVEEGQQLTENQIVGAVDSVQLSLKKQQLKATQRAMLTRRPNMTKQIAATEQQIATAKTERKRIENLVSANAANQKQLDDINAQILVLEKQLTAQKSTIETTNDGINGDNDALRIQVEQIEDQLQKCRITSPITGTVLTKYAEKGELAAAGKALFKVADINQMVLRVYITSTQLTELKIGQKVKVFADFGADEQKAYDGVVSWISSKSEFTPKTIATRDERANMVYAVKVNVKNDGMLKIGMYGNIDLK